MLLLVLAEIMTLFNLRIHSHFCWVSLYYELKLYNYKLYVFFCSCPGFDTEQTVHTSSYRGLLKGGRNRKKGFNHSSEHTQWTPLSPVLMSFSSLFILVSEPMWPFDPLTYISILLLNLPFFPFPLTPFLSPLLFCNNWCVRLGSTP